MIKTIIDTNVIISALLRPGKIPNLVLKIILEDPNFDLLISNSILKEYKDVASRSKFSKYNDFQTSVQYTLSNIQQKSTLYEVSKLTNYLNDKSDNKFIDLAIEAGADIITTRNIKDFEPVINKFDFQILSPKEFYEKYHK